MTYLILGAKWRDKINGNTYCNARIIDGATGDTVGYIGYQYGYGDQYLYEAKKFVRRQFGDDAKAVDIGCFYINKKELKNNNF